MAKTSGMHVGDDDPLPQPPGANPVDVHVGNRVRLRRRFLKLNQQALASALGLTFQQIQKYERGANRISASKLYEIATVLKTSIAYFYDGIEGDTVGGGTGASAPEAQIQAFLRTQEGIELANRFPRIKSRARRRRLLDLVNALAEVTPPGA